jgi:hypothetical protein
LFSNIIIYLEYENNIFKIIAKNNNIRNIYVNTDKYSIQKNLSINKNQFIILIILNSENKLLYSNNGKKLYNQNQKASLLEILLFLYFKSIYLINHHSNIGVNIKYIIRNITIEIIVSIIYSE